MSYFSRFFIKELINQIVSVFTISTFTGVDLVRSNAFGVDIIFTPYQLKI